MGDEVVRSKKVRQGDKVLVIAGNARGLTGEVVGCVGDRVVIRGVNMCKRHVKRTKENQNGGFVDVERPIHVSNVAPCDEQGNAVKLKVRTSEKGEREFIYMKDGQPVVWRSIQRTKK
jgi:large subunit ribosomal protein L24